MAWGQLLGSDQPGTYSEAGSTDMHAPPRKVSAGYSVAGCIADDCKDVKCELFAGFTRLQDMVVSI